MAGEALLNDAAAIALFTLLLTIQLGGQGGGAGTAALHFVRQFVGGLIFGYICARSRRRACFPGSRTCAWRRSVSPWRCPTSPIIVGERGLGVSGVVAAVAAGLVLNAIGQPRIAPGDWRFLHDLWEQLAFWASSLIFMLASLLRAAARNQRQLARRWVLLLVLVVAALVARAVVLFALIPALTALRWSQHIDNRFKAVILWGGLRGAVTLALALAVTENRAIDPAVQRFIAVARDRLRAVHAAHQRHDAPAADSDPGAGPTVTLRSGAANAGAGAVARSRVDVMRRVGRQFRFPDDLVASVASDVSCGRPRLQRRRCTARPFRHWLTTTPTVCGSD